MRRQPISFKTLMFLICFGLFCLSGTELSRGIGRYAIERDRNRTLAHQVQAIRAETSGHRETEGKESFARQPLPQYADLYEQNHDLAGWLRIEGTQIDYPVMHTPEEPEYYLHRDFYGNHADGGCLFIGGGVARGEGNTIIYGHHMGDGSMFARLLSYGEQDFADRHPIICYDTCYEEGRYQVAAAFYSDLDGAGENGFAYYEYLDLSEEAAFQDYIGQAAANSVIETGITPAFGEELITLSTCSYHRENGRFVVVAKKIEDSSAIKD